MPGDTQGTVKITQSFQIVLCLHSYLTILKTSEIYLKMSAEKNLDLICARKKKNGTRSQPKQNTEVE